MATPVLFPSAFTTGEVAPALFGNVQLARMHSAAATMRNMFVGYQGGAYSRAGTAFVGFSKQTGRAYPPRLISFQFSITQGLALEFGNFYMRVMFDGAYVTETPYQVIAVANTNPVEVTVIGQSSAQTATAVNSGVTASYVVGDQITLSGSFTLPTVLKVTETAIASLSLNTLGQGYAPGDTIILSGGVADIPGQVTVTTTQVLSAALVSGGSGLTTGAQTATGTTGAGTKVQLSVTVSAGGVVTAINSISNAGQYSTNPTNLAAEPMTGVPGGGGAVQPVVSLVMEIKTVTLSNPGTYTVNSPTFTQAATSGSGSGATFNSVVYGVGTASIVSSGEWPVTPANPVAQGSTTGTGLGVKFNMTWLAPPASLNDGDWMFLSGLGGPNFLNNETFVIKPAGSVLSLFDVYGNPIDGTTLPAYTGGGTAARIFTVTTQYSEQDLDWLKLTQSADVMSLCCVNQTTGTEYPAVDLARLSNTNWVFTPAVPTPSITPPGVVTASASAAGSYEFAYVVTAVSPNDGTESIASPIGAVFNAVDIATTAGVITVNWTRVNGANQYNIYKATPAPATVEIPNGSLFGYAGTAYGLSFNDSNIVPDFSQVPPQHRNPFARGQLLNVTPINGGSGYTVVNLVINTVNGTGAIVVPIIESTSVVGYIIQDPGSGYAATDTITVSGDGTGATAKLTVGPQTGTYPGVVAYFQERRAYAYTLNQPDTYFMSQPGAFTNFDVRIPTIDSDAITGSPWSVQVNGVQWMVPIGGALMCLTGAEAFLLTGAGGSAFTPQPLTPASQDAQQQGFNGCSATIPPIRIYQDVLYVQSQGATYRDFRFDISNYSYTAEDITQNSTHLFRGFNIVQHAWCEEPYRVLWAIREDGILLSLTWLKSEKIAGWARHDTYGTFVSLCSVSEPPVDALYVATQRTIGTHTAYVVERMDNRLWDSVEDAWCVDCGLTLPLSEPNATISASSPTGSGTITGVANLVGGSGYSAATTVSVVDDNGEGPGSGAVAVPTIVGGVITAIAFSNGGQGYVYPQIVINDPAGSAGGSGASATAILTNSATFQTTEAVFTAGNVGSVLRMGGGVATITQYVSPTQVTANITTPIAQTYPDAQGNPQVIPQTAGNWTIGTPVTTVGGLNALIGATVTGLADGVKIPPQVVSAQGTITLSQPASKITVGLPFQAQLQSVYLDAGEPTVQGRRKNIPEVTVRVEASGPFLAGSNQPDGSTLSPRQIAPTWSGLETAQLSPNLVQASYNSQTVPLYTGDVLVPINSGDAKPGQVCVQQNDPYPLNVLAFIPYVLEGDLPSQVWPEKQRQR